MSERKSPIDWLIGVILLVGGPGTWSRTNRGFGGPVLVVAKLCGLCWSCVYAHEGGGGGVGG